MQVVTEGLRGKTRWWRKAPLELSHPTRALLGNECSLMLFAAGSAAKEQWFTVLGTGRIRMQSDFLIWVDRVLGRDGRGFPRSTQLRLHLIASLRIRCPVVPLFTYPVTGLFQLFLTPYILLNLTASY